MQHYKKRFERALQACLPDIESAPTRLHQAIHYSVLNGGKRIRPLLTYATGAALKIAPEHLDAIACAIELIHCYSLVHDDLPAMDDDDLRRGKPTAHIAFDPATAILAGDALQSLAFELLATDAFLSREPHIALQLIAILARASGSLGMAGGQAIDLEAENKQLSLPELEKMHRLKTGQIIRAAIVMPCYVKKGLPQGTIDKLDRFANCIGLAFQIRDDILDVTGSTEVIGKPQGSDISQRKSTYTSLLGLKEAEQKADALYQEACDILTSYGEAANDLRYLAQLIVERDR